MTGESDEQIEQHIAEFGWHGHAVEPAVSDDEQWPTYAYTIGWGVSRDWPEVVIVGAKPELAYSMMWRIWENEVRPAAGADDAGILDGFVCRFLPVDPSWRSLLFGAAIDAYRRRNRPQFDMMQCVLPTTAGVMPWDAAATEQLKALQPLLDAPKPEGLDW